MLIGKLNDGGRENRLETGCFEPKRENLGAYRRLYSDHSWPVCADADELLAAQGFACAMCGMNLREPGSRRALDHCHFCGLVRGWLCNRCNVLESRAVDEKFSDYRTEPPAVLACLSQRYHGRGRLEGFNRYSRNVSSGYPSGALPGDCEPDLRSIIDLCQEENARLRREVAVIGAHRDEWIAYVKARDDEWRGHAKVLGVSWGNRLAKAAMESTAAESRSAKAMDEARFGRRAAKSGVAMGLVLWLANMLAWMIVSEPATVVPRAFMLLLCLMVCHAVTVVWEVYRGAFDLCANHVLRYVTLGMVLLILFGFGIVGMLVGTKVLSSSIFGTAVGWVLLLGIISQIAFMVGAAISLRRSNR